MLAERNAGEGQRTVRRDAAHNRPRGGGLRTPDGWYSRWKGRIEWLAALALVVPAVPLIVLAALLVKLTSRGPAFYTQGRVGRHGRPYTIYKIRTMFHGAENGTGPCWAADCDPRITLIGRFLRRTHLDELPQLWNVLRGDMGLVGPRPERPEFVSKLALVIPRYSDRLLAQPGVTGLAQVQLPADTDLDSVRRKLAHDLYYLQQVNIWLDLWVVLLTACDLLSIPSSLSRMIFRVPSSEVIEQAYEQLIAADHEEVPVQSA